MTISRAEFDQLTKTVSQESYDLCDLENSNLRRCLAWCGPKLSIEDRRALAGMIKRPLKDGGVTEDLAEDDRCDLADCQKLMARLVAHIELAINSEKLVLGWFHEAEKLCERAREWEPDKQELSLYDLRAMAEDADREMHDRVTPRNKVDSLGTTLRLKGAKA